MERIQRSIHDVLDLRRAKARLAKGGFGGFAFRISGCVQPPGSWKRHGDHLGSGAELSFLLLPLPQHLHRVNATTTVLT